MKEGRIKEILQEIRRLKDNPEAIDKFLNAELEEKFKKTLQRSQRTDPLMKQLPSKYKARATDDFLHDILGQIATEELEGIDKLKPEDQYKKILETAYPEIKDLQKSINYNPNIYVKDLPPNIAGSWQPSKGIVLSKKFAEDPSRKLTMRGTVLHEGGHGIDDTAAKLKELLDEIDVREERPKVLQFRDLNQYDPNKTIFQNMKNSELYRYFENVRDKLDKFKDKNPEKIESLLDQEAVKKFESLPYPDDFEHPTYANKTPLELQDLHTRGHFFNRNFAKGNVLKSIKDGIKGVKSLGVSMLPAAALGAIAAYSPDTMAGTIARTGTKVLDEGDPTSVLFPPEAGDGEEQEVQRMIKEKEVEEAQKIKKESNLTDEQMRRWSKIKDQLKR